MFAGWSETDACTPTTVIVVWVPGYLRTPGRLCKLALSLLSALGIIRDTLQLTFPKREPPGLGLRRPYVRPSGQQYPQIAEQRICRMLIIRRRKYCRKDDFFLSCTTTGVQCTGAPCTGCAAYTFLACRGATSRMVSGSSPG